MSVIEAASVRIATLADGSLRLTVDVEPTHAQAAFSLFGAPGTPMALAALKVGHAAKSYEPAVEEKPKGGPLAKLAGIWCNDPEFQAWLTKRGDFAKPLDAESAAEVVRTWCGITSRAQLDCEPLAEGKFQQFIRGPYMKHQLATSA